MSSLKALKVLGQAPWLDFVSRDFIARGELARLIAEDGVTGVTSNPAIFEKAIAGAPSYGAAIEALLAKGDLPVNDIYERLAVEDIQKAADALRGVYEETGGADGYVSLEVSPYLADDTQGTIVEALRLWTAVHRPNAMIKVPATAAGIAAIRTLIAKGLSINVTLLFSASVYEQVAQAYLEGLEDFTAKGGNPARVASVASFFVSRIDSAIDAKIDAHRDAARLAPLKGRAAIANAKIAYRSYKALFSGARWQALAAKGAHVQRLLWASTGTKNPAYSDVLYVEELIGPDTVNTLPPATLDAFRDHGKPAATLETGIDDAQAVLAKLADAGLLLEPVAADLVKAGVALFADAADSLLGAVARKRAEILTPRLNGAQMSLPPRLAQDVARAAQDWRAGGKVRRLWAKDAALWSNGPEAKWLGWLDVAQREYARIGEYESLAADIKAGGFSDLLLLGMGGSSLGPEVIAETLGSAPGFPRLRIVDSTDPDQVRETAAAIDPSTTLFLVSSKSGSTLEPNVLKDYFWDLAAKAVGKDKVGGRFVAVTDPGSSLEKDATRDGFRAIWKGDPTIGGRFSALSPFGLVPAAMSGVDVRAFLESALLMIRACASDVPPAENPGVALGLVLGAAALQGQDKVTIFASKGFSAFGAWTEQLVAESTGKHGKAIIPVDGETIAAPEAYGCDRLFVHLRLDHENDAALDKAVEALRAAGRPVVTLALRNAQTLGQEFFRWEIATAVAGAMLGIDPFDQPDVEASKIKTRALTDAIEKTGALPAETPVFASASIDLYTDEKNAGALKASLEGTDLTAWLKAHFARIGANDYVTILAYLSRNAHNDAALQRIRQPLRDKTKAATCVGFGPRFLHSTGQAYKGGPNSCFVLQITADEAELAVPGRGYGFALIEAAQARGDFEVLIERGRRALRVHLKGDLKKALSELETAVNEALRQGSHPGAIAAPARLR